MRPAFSASAPGNLLLVGEYAVTREGGLGLALAAAPRARLEVRAPSAESPRRLRPPLLVESRMRGPARAWSPGTADNPLLEACLAAAAERSGHPGTPEAAAEALRGWRLIVDTGDFFGADGAKRGLGSSAAAAVLACAGFLAALGGEEAPDREVFAAALAAHRAAQGGRGSGYDVAASVFGGLGLFKGGAAPDWLPARSAALPPGLLVFGAEPVSSARAVERFAAWSERNPTGLAAYGAAAATLARTLLEAAGGMAEVAVEPAPGMAQPGDFLPALHGTGSAGETAERAGGAARDSGPGAAFGEAFRKAAGLGERLGEAIGVPARFALPSLLAEAGLPVKSLGAGDELAAVFALDAEGRNRLASLREALGAAATPLVLERDGLRWE